MPQFILVEMEGAYPEDGVVLVEEEPGVADGVEVAYDVLVAGRGWINSLRSLVVTKFATPPAQA